MNKSLSVLFAGESWFTDITETKGVDSFSMRKYEEAAFWVGNALEEAGISFTHVPSHRIDADFPDTAEKLSVYDVVMLSDVGSNTFLLPEKTFFEGRRMPNKLELIKQFTEQGGGFCMIGGYMTFQGFGAKANYKRTVIEHILPVELLEGDDRIEKPEGFCMSIKEHGHPVFNGIPGEFPHMLGYNRLIAKPGAEVLAVYNGDPMIAVHEYGKGRAMAYACDCSPHWASPELCGWEYYNMLWQNIACWLSGKGA